MDNDLDRRDRTMSKTICVSCKHELMAVDLLPCVICKDIQNGNKSYWTPKEKEQ